MNESYCNYLIKCQTNAILVFFCFDLVSVLYYMYIILVCGNNNTWHPPFQVEQNICLHSNSNSHCTYVYIFISVSAE